MITVARTLSLDVGLEKVWAFLWDIPRLSGCIPGCRQVETVEDQQSYKAVLEQQVGPFKMAIDLRIRVTGVDPLKQVSLAIQGEDPKLQVRVDQSLDVALRAVAESQTELEINSQVDAGGGIFGRIGKPLLQLHINRVVDDFARCLRTSISTAVG